MVYDIYKQFYCRPLTSTRSSSEQHISIRSCKVWENICISILAAPSPVKWSWNEESDRLRRVITNGLEIKTNALFEIMTYSWMYEDNTSICLVFSARYHNNWIIRYSRRICFSLNDYTLVFDSLALFDMTHFVNLSFVGRKPIPIWNQYLRTRIALWQRNTSIVPIHISICVCIYIYMYIRYGFSNLQDN